ncbi:MAG: RNA polymerase sigma factor [Planctomycetota bacterium]|jgi:RNA polymerase sigma-70 factor (ECF subfamily)
MANGLADIEDQILVMDAQDGDAKAMEELVRRWQRRLWQHAFRLTADTQAAWDVTQQTWLGVIKGLRRLRDPANFKAWAYGITTNKSIDWIKKSRAARQVSIEEVSGRQQKEKKQIGLNELLEKLEFKKKLILTLYYFENLNITDISVAMKIPKGTVKSRLYSARNGLKELYEKEYE